VSRPPFVQRLIDVGRSRRRFWESVPRRGHVLILVAVFSIFSTFGFLADMMALGRVSPSGVLAMAAMSGLITALFALAMIRHGGFLIPAVALIAAMNWIWTPTGALPPVTDSLRPISDRMRNDSLAIISALTTGYTCFLVFIAVEGRRYARAHTEVALAREIHQRLVPPIGRTIAGVEFFGVSLPSSEVGGDLVDVIDLGGAWVACLADVSGHGVASGALMGMFKAAVRTRLASDAPLDRVLDDVDQVMIDLRKPGMFVTCAMVSSAGPHNVQFTLAGHPPILRVRRDTTTVEELSIAQPPVALLDEPRAFRSDCVAVADGDLLALVSDGLTEVFDAADREYGIDRLKETLGRHATRPLSEVFEAIVSEVRRHGRQLDDQSLLLVRIGEERDRIPTA
jgi:Stage II sporulation protein E (SpoIIE)